MQTVDVKGYGTVEFPDGMTPEEMGHIIETQFIPMRDSQRSTIGALKSGYQSGMGAANLGIAQLASSLGAEDFAAGRRKTGEEYLKESEQSFKPLTEADVAQAKEEYGVPGELYALGRQKILHPLAGMAGRYGIPTAAGAAAGALAPELGGAALLARGAGFLGTDVPAEMGENILEARHAGTATPEMGENLATSLVQSAIGAFGLPFTGKLSNALLREAGPLAERVAAGSLSKEAAVQALGSRGVNVAKEIGANALTNAAAMTGIEALRRGVTDQELASPEALERYGEGAETAALLAPIFGGYHGVAGHRKALSQIEAAREPQPEAPVAPSVTREEAGVPEPTLRTTPGGVRAPRARETVEPTPEAVEPTPEAAPEAPITPEAVEPTPEAAPQAEPITPEAAARDKAFNDVHRLFTNLKDGFNKGAELAETEGDPSLLKKVRKHALNNLNKITDKKSAARIADFLLEEGNINNELEWINNGDIEAAVSRLAERYAGQQTPEAPKAFRDEIGLSPNTKLYSELENLDPKDPAQYSAVVDLLDTHANTKYDSAKADELLAKAEDAHVAPEEAPTVAPAVEPAVEQPPEVEMPKTEPVPEVEVPKAEEPPEIEVPEINPEELSAAPEAKPFDEVEKLKAVAPEPIEDAHTPETLQEAMTAQYGKEAPVFETSTIEAEGVEPNTKAFFDPAKARVVLFPENISKGEYIHGLMRHEVGVHARRLGKEDPEFQALLGQLEGLKAKSKVVQEAYAKVPENTAPENIHEEALGYLVHNAPSLPLVKRFMSWLRRTAYKATNNAKWLKENDFAPMADAVLKSKEAYAPRTGEKLYAKTKPQDKTIEDLLEPAKRTTKSKGPNTIATNIGEMKDTLTKVQDNFWTKARIKVLDPSEALGKALSKRAIMENGVLRAEHIVRANKQIGSIAKAGMELGVPEKTKAGVLKIKEDPRLALANIMKRTKDIGNKHGFDGYEVVQEVWRAMLGKETLKADEAMRQKAATMKAEAKQHADNAKAMAKAGAKIGDIKAELTKAANLRRHAATRKDINRERVVTKDRIAKAEAVLAKYPEVKEIIDDTRDMLRELVNLGESVGLYDKATAKEFNKNPYYMPMYKPEDMLELDKGGKHFVSGITPSNVARVKGRKGHEHKVNLWDNLQKHYVFMAASASQNLARKIAVEQLVATGSAKKALDQTPSSKDGDLALYEDGKKVWYKVDDPLILEAFTSASYVLNPLLKAANFATRTLRTGALVNPVFWYRELIRNPLHATFVADVGVITPFHAMQEFTKILAGRSPEAKELRKSGVTGSYDTGYNYNDLQQQIGRAVNPEKGAWKKAMESLIHVQEATDAATRVAVYKSAYKIAKRQGMADEDAKAFAVDKARESINFAVHGNSETLNALRSMTPFLSATLNSLDTVYRAATGHNLNPKEKKAAQTKFIKRAAWTFVLSGIYAMLMQDDKSYQELSDREREGNWLVAGPDDEYGRHTFLKVPTPYEIGFMFKTLPEQLVRLMNGNATNKDFFASMARGLGNNMPVPTMQLIKPAIESMTNYNFYTGHNIEGLHERTKSVGQRDTGASDLAVWMSNDLGLKGINLSPLKVDHLIRGYFAELGSIGTAMADHLIQEVEGKKTTPIKSAYKTPLVRGMVTDPESSRSMTKLYETSAMANQTVADINEFKSKANIEMLQKYMQDPEKLESAVMANVLKPFMQQEAEIRKAMGVLANLPDSETNRKKLRELKAAANELAEAAANQIRNMEGD